MWSTFFTLSLALQLALQRVAADAPDSSPGKVPDKKCRNVPGSAGFPTSEEWATLNTTVGGRLVNVVPFVKFCETQPGGCTPRQFTSSVFRDTVPGAMNLVNWEQDYDSVPPSLCQPESPQTCGQGDVPIFGILAQTVSDIQAGVMFARTHNLRLAVKASGHDILGRSTAKNSLLISTHGMQSSSFTDNFIVGGEDLGSAVTLGSGVPLSEMYSLTKAQGKIAVGGSASTVVAAGGYVQGGGHSALSPTFGLAADNCLELNVVIANGQLVKANSVQNSDLFWAMRGGGAGSWGVIVNATFRTFPTFDAIISTVTIITNTTEQMSEVTAVHANHIFDLDEFRVGQYFSLSTPGPVNPPAGSPKLTIVITTYFPNASLAQATSALQPFLDDVQQVEGVSLTQTTNQTNINDALFIPDDIAGVNVVFGSRLIPASAYQNNSQLVAQVFQELINSGSAIIVAAMVAGGKVSENADISNAIIPAWRTAKTHLMLGNFWLDEATIDQVNGNMTFFRDTQLPILEKLSGPDAGAYSNEGDTLEADFQQTFFGCNYAKLSEIKSRYDPADLFIVKAGVGSERWDVDGVCLV